MSVPQRGSVWLRSVSPRRATRYRVVVLTPMPRKTFMLMRLFCIVLLSLTSFAVPAQTQQHPEYLWYEAENMRGFTTGKIGEPILNPVTGAPHRARIDVVGGFEYSIAEIGRGWTKTARPIEIELADSYAQFAEIHLCQTGIVR